MTITNPTLNYVCFTIQCYVVYTCITCVLSIGNDVICRLFQTHWKAHSSTQNISIRPILECKYLHFYNIHWLSAVCTIPDIIKFTYYHCTSIDYSVLQCTLWVKYIVLWMYYTVLHLSTILSHTNVKRIHTLQWLQYKVVL